MIEPCLLARHDRLGANGVILVEMEVEDVHLSASQKSSNGALIKNDNSVRLYLPVHGDRCKDGARVWRPSDVAHLCVEVEHEERLPAIKGMLDRSTSRWTESTV